jgi:hypothetical protein
MSSTARPKADASSHQAASGRRISPTSNSVACTTRAPGAGKTHVLESVEQSALNAMFHSIATSDTINDNAPTWTKVAIKHPGQQRRADQQCQ